MEDVDELILRVGSRTLARLDAALTAAESDGETAPVDVLVRIAVAYCDFAAENLELWRALFEHRMARGKPIPDWAVEEQMNLFRHIYHPLATLFPKRSAAELGVTARSLFSAVHGMVALGLEQKLIAVPVDALRAGDRDHRAGDGIGAHLIPHRRPRLSPTPPSETSPAEFRGER